MSKRGKKRLGCLFTLLIVATVGYYGIDPGNLLFKSWQLEQEMKAQAGFAQSVDNAAIQRRLARKIDNLGLPDVARRNLRIRRTFQPREIIITTEFEVTIVLPFTTKVYTFNPEVRSPL